MIIIGGRCPNSLVVKHVLGKDESQVRFLLRAPQTHHLPDMKAIFVESSDGYLARGADDNMVWTPALDKKVFKLLSYSLGGVCVCSRHTYNLLPDAMRNDKNRKFIVAGKSGINSLENINKRYPNGILIGGPRFLTMAYIAGVIDTFIVTTVNMPINSTSEYKNPFEKVLSTIKPQCEIKFDEMVVRVYKNNSRSR